MAADHSDIDVMLYSDGGSSSGSNAAGACVLEDRSRHTRLCLAVYLASATNNEAEIAAALLGFAALRAQHGEGAKLNVHWVSDSEYLLKSATAYILNWQKNGWKTAEKKPVKNQGLWRAYLALTKGMKIKTEHVRGHTGHPENEACDEASQWAKNCGEELDAGRNWAREELDTHIGRDSWTCFDGRPLIEQLRADAASGEEGRELVDILKMFFSAGSGGESTPRPPSLRPALAHLEQARTAAERIAGRSEEAEDLVKKISKLIKEFSAE